MRDEMALNLSLIETQGQREWCVSLLKIVTADSEFFGGK